MIPNKTALYVLLGALVLAALTNRWVAASGHPKVYKLHELLDGPPVPSLYTFCNTRVYSFLKLADGRLLALRDPHQEDLQIGYLTR